MRKTIIITVAILLLLIVVFFIYSGWHLRASLPVTSGTFESKNIDSDIEITFDKMGIPQIWSENMADCWYGAGWLHANDRLFQMEITRRVSQGRLSEILGEYALDLDKMQRKIGHMNHAAKALKKLDRQSLLFLRSYVNGINQRVLNFKAMPFEFAILGIDYEKWTVKDCLTLLSFQTWYSDALQNHDELIIKILDQFDHESLNQIMLPYPVWAPLTVPQPSENIFGLNYLNKLDGFTQNLIQNNMTQSSNAWVVAPHRSASGKAMLASDPHLDVSRLPQFWYMMGIHARNDSLDVLGITTPGLPMIAMGHNGKAAWAFTVAGIKLTEIYREQIHRDNPEMYKTQDGWSDFQESSELIFLRGESKPETLKVRRTERGPVLHQNDSSGYAYTLHWAGDYVKIENAVKSMFEMPQIDSFDHFRNIVTNLGALNANWLYADQGGTIGYQLGAPVPVRNIHPYDILPEGWNREHQWDGLYTINKTPYVVNPERGWLASSNNKPDEENLEYELLGNFSNDRILRISQLLGSKEKFSKEDFQKFQQDINSQYLLRWREIVAGHLENAGETEMASRIRKWDGAVSRNSYEAAVINVWIHVMKEMVFEDELDKLYRRIGHIVLEEILTKPDSDWYDNINTGDKKEDAVEILGDVTRKTLEICNNKTWGEIQYVTFEHPLSVVPLLSGILNLKRGPFPRAGASSTLNASFNVLKEERVKSVIAPSWRFIIDFENVDKAVFVLPAGQSGHPLSVHFFDFYDLWNRGIYWQVPISENQIYAEKVSSVFIKKVSR